MEIDAMLCDHAEAAQGKLFINGAAINTFWVEPQPPHFIQAYVAAVVQVPYTATNQPHTLDVELIDQDGQPVKPWAPEGIEVPPGIKVTTPFNIGRPPMIEVGDVQVFPVAIGFQIPLPEIGLYHFAIWIDGTEMERLPLRVAVQPQVQAFGPASIAGLG